MLLSALLLTGWLSAAAGQVPADTQDLDLGCAHAKSAAATWAAGRDAAAVAAGAEPPQTDVQHYHLDIELRPDIEWLGGSNTMTVRSLVDGLNEFSFRLQGVFNISEVRVDGGAALWQRTDDATVAVGLTSAYNTNDVFEIYVAYDGVPDPPSGGFGPIVFRTRQGAPEVWTLSEPWFAYTWWPAKDDSTDKTTADLWFTVPDGMEVASNGVLQGTDDVGDGKRRFRWQTQYPTADYLYCIGATNYNTFGDTWQYDGGSMPLSLYIYPEHDNPDNRDAWLINLDMLDVFSAAYGLYPFADEKYGMCEVGFGGGMEHQTMTSQGTFAEYITAHEQAHQWWGDMVTCATWNDIWLNEGFATYSEALWFGDKPGGSTQDYHDWMDVRRPSQVGDSVYVYDATDVGRIFSGTFTYRKGAWVVHMFRHVVGDQTFFDIVAAYRAAFEYDSAITDDLRGVAEGVYGQDLGWFFDEWIYDIGAPEYEYAWQQHIVAGTRFIELYLEQVQPAGYPVFSMPVDVAMGGLSGDSLEVVWNDAAAEHLLFEIPAGVTTLTIDPDDWILNTGKFQVAFVEGPPKIVAASPAPGSQVEPVAVGEITIVFHKDVVVSAVDFSVVGASAGSVPFSFGYDGATHTATLTPDDVLPADTYTVTVADSIVDAAAGLALDGEIAGPNDPQSLPSGDGLAGGSGALSFIAVSACPADLNGDGQVGPSDLALLLGSWGPCAGCVADLDGNDAVDAADLAQLLGLWGPC